MNIHLTPELEQLVESKMRLGDYSSAGEVVGDALRLMERRDQLQAAQREDILRKIADGIASLSQGKGIDGEAFFAELEAEFDEELREQGSRQSGAGLAARR